MKSTNRMLAVFCGVLLLGGLTFATVNAQYLANQKTYFTFSHSVVLPNGVRLEPGRYTFRLADTMANRNIVQVLNEDESKILAMFMTINAPNRLESGNDSVITFAESSPTAPQPVRYWYYPGQYTGHEFVYGRAEAERIARESHTRVLATDDAVTNKEQMQQAEIVAVAPTGEASSYESNQATSTVPTDTAQPTYQSAEQSSSTTTSATADTRTSSSGAVGTSGQAATRQTADQSTTGTQPQSRVARNELPRTAGFDPLLGLMGLMSLGGFVALRIRAR